MLVGVGRIKISFWRLTHTCICYSTLHVWVVISHAVLSKSLGHMSCLHGDRLGWVRGRKCWAFFQDDSDSPIVGAWKALTISPKVAQKITIRFFESEKFTGDVSRPGVCTLDEGQNRDFCCLTHTELLVCDSGDPRKSAQKSYERGAPNQKCIFFAFSRRKTNFQDSLTTPSHYAKGCTKRYRRKIYPNFDSSKTICPDQYLTRLFRIFSS